MTGTDASTTIQQLRDRVRRFVAERNWQSYHSPKNISMAMAIEVAELMEHFQWLTNDASRLVGHNPDQLELVRDELADVLCYVLALANELDIDVSQALHTKMEKNERKYPR